MIYCVGSVLSDVNCKSKWVLQHNNTVAPGSTFQGNPDTLVECQKLCEVDRRCVSVDRRTYQRLECFLNINPSHDHWHFDPDDKHNEWIQYLSHYELVSRCNITSG